MTFHSKSTNSYSPHVGSRGRNERIKNPTEDEALRCIEKERRDEEKRSRITSLRLLPKALMVVTAEESKNEGKMREYFARSLKRGVLPIPMPPVYTTLLSIYRDVAIASILVLLGFMDEVVICSPYRTLTPFEWEIINRAQSMEKSTVNLYGEKYHGKR